LWFDTVRDKAFDQLNFEWLHGGGMAVLCYRQNHAVILLRAAHRSMFMLVGIVGVFVRFEVSGLGFCSYGKLFEEVMNAVRRRDSQKQQ